MEESKLFIVHFDVSCNVTSLILLGYSFSAVDKFCAHMYVRRHIYPQIPISTDLTLEAEAILLVSFKIGLLTGTSKKPLK